jgi:hypothetical protein
LATIVFLATLAPLAWYGRLFVIGLAKPDRVVEPVDAWRPHVTPPDLTALRRWMRTTWDGNRAFTTASVALLLGVLALATAAGAFGGAAAAAGLPPSLEAPGDVVAPAGSGSPPGPLESVGP